MFAVETYVAVRRFIRRGEEQARGGAGLWAEPEHDFQDVPLFRATRLCAKLTETLPRASQGLGDATPRANAPELRAFLLRRQSGNSSLKLQGKDQGPEQAERHRSALQHLRLRDFCEKSP
jgi:hypothetical protein